jgi:predicted nucleic-acid-binding protein
VETDEIIAQLDNFQARLFIRRNGQVEPADPNTLANNLLLIRGLLIQLVDKVAESESIYRKTKAERFDSFLTAHKPGEKAISKSAAMDKLDMEEDLIDMKIGSERVKNYMKYVDGLCTSIQSVLKVQSSSEKSQY